MAGHRGMAGHRCSFASLVGLLRASALAWGSEAGCSNREGGGVCPTNGGAFVQLKTSTDRKSHRAGAHLGELRMLKYFQGELVANSSEVLLQSRATRPATMSEKEAFTAAHNLVRCRHGSPAVVWSDAMAESANAYASPLTSLRHSDSYNLAPPAGPSGENLFWSSSQSTPEQVVQSWYDEVKDCIGGPAGFTDGCYAGVSGRVTGHFTALIWRGVKEIGCAWSDDGKIALCRYKGDDVSNGNTPNMGGHYVEQVPQRIKSEAECRAGGSTPTAAPAPSPTPSPPAPPATPAPTPSPATPAPAPPSCADSTSYRDPWWGASCSGWSNSRCSGYFFSNTLRSNCPLACGVCTPPQPSPGPAPPTPTPAPPSPAPPSPAPPTPAPPTPAPAGPTPAPPAPPGPPAPPTSGACVRGVGAAGCVMQSSGCEGQVSFRVRCSGHDGQGYTYELSMPDDYNWDLGQYCLQCSDVQVI